MAEPVAKPVRAGFISLRSPTFPRGVELCHKLSHGNVDLQFGGWGERMAGFRRVVEALLAPGMTVARAAKSASIPLRVARLNAARGFSEQEAAAVRGFALRVCCSGGSGPIEQHERCFRAERRTDRPVLRDWQGLFWRSRRSMPSSVRLLRPWLRRPRSRPEASLLV